ncbi:Muskelin N-terminus-domain-containing protein [Vararia minispora EC-137]|uniref:Muskelin N-terminus-domain-containing protein n=1 Tax=Vararia minispora EC-137 TaxID=1314806 RepID=A0ACB8QG49_9AGAM|nr:Muskelin N-terminus-domain-containing protein [Vararia minispora EC-137]
MEGAPGLPSPETLTFAIAGCSEHSGRYVAENILVNRPHDQTSRWSGLDEDPHIKQWLLLRLDKPAVIQSISFGKYHKPHPCNMKEFKIYAGLNANEMTEILHDSLKNDSSPETFSLRYTKSTGVHFPSRFVKIVPLTVHGDTRYHISIWHVSLAGIKDEAIVESVTLKFNNYRETAALRHILKHLRARRLLSPYRSLLAMSDVQIEHPLVTRLYESLVSDGDWAEAEKVIHIAAEAGLFDTFLQASQTRAVWKRLSGADADGDYPSRRGGHAMCIDEDTGVIYLFGGWDGQNSLDDFWVYTIADDRWQRISEHAAANNGGPGPRSCHRMAFDSKTGYIYLLGRLSDSDGDSEDVADPSGEHTRQSSSDTANQEYPAEFYRYHTQGSIAGSWELLSGDTASAGGPPLIFDHQMAMDSAAQVLYVSGGRVCDGSSGAVKYSGFYSYEVSSNKWTLLQYASLLFPNICSCTLESLTVHAGHCMLFEPNERSLYIFAGMEDGDRYLADMYIYDIENNASSQVFANFTAAGGPDKTFTQRAVIDPTLQEIYVLCGLTRSHSTSLPRPGRTNWLYRYDEQPGKWSRILPETPNSDERATIQPRTRYGHQIVYDSRNKTVYLHGGNAGRVFGEADGEELEEQGGRAAEVRLNDLWSMTLKRPEAEEAIRRAKFEIRCQQFREMCDNINAVDALRFLQNDIADIVDHSTSETETFRSLLAYLLSKQSLASKTLPHETGKEISTAMTQARTRVFENLLQLFPSDAKEPSPNLVDMIDWYEESAHD